MTTMDQADHVSQTMIAVIAHMWPVIIKKMVLV